MTPVKTPACNFTYTAPPSMPECMDLPCCVHQQGTTSFWKLDAAELSQLAAGGHVAFTHYGKGHPIIALHVTPGETMPPMPERSPAQRVIAGLHGLRFTRDEARLICERVMLHSTAPEG